MRGRWLVWMASVFALGGCESVNMHVFFAAHYDASRDCLESTTAIDVLEGAEPARCDQTRCWLHPDTSEPYISWGVCNGPKGWSSFTEAADDTPCGKALAAERRGTDGRCGSAADASASAD